METKPQDLYDKLRFTREILKQIDELESERETLRGFIDATYFRTDLEYRDGNSGWVRTVRMCIEPRKIKMNDESELLEKFVENLRNLYKEKIEFIDAMILKLSSHITYEGQYEKL